MSMFSSHDPARWLTVEGVREQCHAMLTALSHQPSRIDEDSRLYAVVVITLGTLPCVLMAFIIFAK
jgi:hypothetical protein